jgi:hypothetical protein
VVLKVTSEEAKKRDLTVTDNVTLQLSVMEDAHTGGGDDDKGLASLDIAITGTAILTAVAVALLVAFLWMRGRRKADGADGSHTDPGSPPGAQYTSPPTARSETSPSGAATPTPAYGPPNEGATPTLTSSVAGGAGEQAATSRQSALAPRPHPVGTRYTHGTGEPPHHGIHGAEQRAGNISGLDSHAPGERYDEERETEHMVKKKPTQEPEVVHEVSRFTWNPEKSRTKRKIKKGSDPKEKLLEKLEKLRDDGALSKEEYEKARKELVDL